jgi:glycosyltransferase involved in cell wall biosynthesis
MDGVGDYTCQLSQALRAKGCDISILTSSDWDGEKTTNGWNVYPVGGNWRSPLTWRRVLRTVLTLKPDVVVLQYVPHAFEKRGLPVTMVLLSAAIRLIIAGKFIVFFHEVRIKINPRRIKSLLLGLPMWIISGAIHLLSHQSITSNEAYRRLLSQYGKDAEVIPVGSNIPLVHHRSMASQWDVSQGDMVLGVFGFGVRGSEVLLEALAVLKAHLSGLKLVALGAYPEAVMQLLRAAISAKGFENQIIIPGYLPADLIAAHFSRIDIFLSLDPSKSLEQWTGTGTKSGTLATAMGFGKPIIAVKGELTDPILEDGSILLLDQLETAAVVDAVLTLARDPQKREALGAKARSAFEQYLSWNHIGQAYIDCFAETAK